MEDTKQDKTEATTPSPSKTEAVKPREVPLIKKLQAEQARLENEMECMKTATDPEQSAKEVIDFMQKTQDPLLSTAENTWRQKTSPDGCCCVQ